jgi:hypothetical protein
MIAMGISSSYAESVLQRPSLSKVLDSLHKIAGFLSAQIY